MFHTVASRIPAGRPERLLPVLALLLLGSPASGANLFGLVDTGELYRSTNGGESWSIHATLPVSDAVGLAASTTASNLTIVTRSGSVFRSLDGGTLVDPG